MPRSGKFSKVERSWILYDVANSAFILIVTAVIPIYFRSLTEAAGIADHESTAYFGFATSAATLILALLSPILGAVADYQGMKKRLFSLALVLGLLGAVSLGLVGTWGSFLAVFVIARLGYAAANVFYDSMLTDVTSDERMDQVSAHGYAWGYVGSCIPFIGCILLILTTPFGLTTTAATQISLVITALWWGLLSLPLLKNVRQTHYLERGRLSVGDVFRRLGRTLRAITRNKPMLYYILAYFLYIDGVYTVISMATAYGSEVGIADSSLILALLLTQFVAFPFAILTGRYASKIGPLRLIRIFIAIYMGVCLFAFQLDKAWEFWLMAVVVGMAQGGIQSLSRSTFGKMVPKEESNEYFGFFDIFGKFADFMGPALVGFIGILTGSSRYGILALVALFAAGFVLLCRIPKEAQ